MSDTSDVPHISDVRHLPMHLVLFHTERLQNYRTSVLFRTSDTSDVRNLSDVRDGRPTSCTCYFTHGYRGIAIWTDVRWFSDVRSIGRPTTNFLSDSCAV